MKNSTIITLVISGLVIALIGILHDRRTASEVRQLRAFHEHQASLQKIKEDAAARFRQEDAKLATQKLLLERERDLKLAQIQEEREADEAREQKRLELLRMRLAAEDALDKASAESESRLLGTEN